MQVALEGQREVGLPTMTEQQGQVSFLLTFSLRPVSNTFPVSVKTGENRILHEISRSPKNIEHSISLKKKRIQKFWEYFCLSIMSTRNESNQILYQLLRHKSFGFFDIKGLSKIFFPLNFEYVENLFYLLFFFSRCLLEEHRNVDKL